MDRSVPISAAPLVSVAVATAAGRSGMADNVAVFGAIVWYLFFATLLLLVPFLSRSRQALWRKGEQSGHVQNLKELRIDCDADTVLIKVEQIGGIACHTGRRCCFFQRLDQGVWRVTDDVIKPPEDIYGKNP